MDFIKEKIYRPIFQVGIGNYIKLKRNKVSFKRLLVFGKLVINNFGGVIQLGENVVIRSGIESNVLGEKTGFEVYPGAELIIREGVNMSNTRIRCENKIIIDENVMIGGGVVLLDSNCHSLDFEERMFDKKGGNILSSPVHIKRGAFIGTGSIILKGSIIGEEAIIAAGSVVTGNEIPDKEIWGGNPAKFIKRIGD